ncbi:MAG TPA: AMP-binding protein [Solirubrobacterales bacterium]
MNSPSIAEDLSRNAARDPDRIAVIVGERQVSFAELDGLVERLAAGLREQGVQRGDRVAIMLPNGIDAVVAIEGTLRAGAAIMPINPTAKHDRVSDLLGRSEAAALLCDEERAGEVSVAVAAVDGVSWFSDLEQLSSDATVPRETPDDADLAALMHTSGSTGGPKGVMHCHGGLGFVTDSIIEYLEVVPEDRILNLLPLSFGYGLTHLLICLRSGSTLVLEPGVGLPGRIVKLLEEQQITGLPGVPTVFQLLLTLRGLAERPLPHLRFLTNAGAALPTPAIEEVRRTFPNATLYSMYGQTECIRTCYLPPDQLDTRPDSVGVSIPGSETWIEDDEGNEVGPGVVGELIVRGPHVMQGYWRDPEATASRVREGHHPGERVLASNDLFRTDEEGYLYFVGRRDDIIKSRGEKVPPREVEEVLHIEPGIKEAAVVGVPDRLLGEAVHAHVSAREGEELDAAALKRLCAEHLEDYMVPQRIVVHDELPRNQNGKIDRLGLANR